MAESPTASEIRALLAHLLAGAAGGNESEWSGLIGEVEVLPVWNHIHCNWRVDASGTKKQRASIEAAVTLVAGEHPYARQ